MARLQSGAEWRIEIDRERGTSETLKVRYEHPDDGLQPDLAGSLHQRLGLKPVLEVVAPGTFGRFSAKASRVIDHREP